MLQVNQKIRVLYVVSRLRRHGPISQLYNIIKYMDKRFFSTRILTLSDEASDTFLTEFSGLGIECYSLRLSRSFGLLFGWNVLRKFLSKHPVDIIHVSDVRSSASVAMLSRKIPRIITRREAFYKGNIASNGILLGSVFEMIYSIACRRADRVVAVSQYVKDTASLSLKRMGIDVIRNAVDTKRFVPVCDNKKRELRKYLSLPQDKKIFITIGWLSDRKDPLHLIEGFLSTELVEQSLLLLIGDGQLRGRCDQLIGGCASVRLLGFINEVVPYLQAADFFVSASHFEGYPNAVMEALACGLPVVLSDIPPHREILNLNPCAGCLFHVRDVSGLAKQMEEIVTADYYSLRASAVSIAEKKLNAQRMSSQYARLYRELYDMSAKNKEVVK
jgi:glycosyltransferase involved in cell wall biosynthesis